MNDETSLSNPLYTQLKDQLLKRIAQGVYKRGEPIPSEGKLADEFGVSVFTVRQAVALLVAENLLVKQQGRRTFVADQKTRLTFFTWLPETKHGERLLAELIAMFEAKYPSLTVECLPTTYVTAKRDLLQRISSGEAPDVAHIVSHWTSYFAYMGAFEKLENLIAQDNLEARFYDKDLWGGSYRNRLYSVGWGLCPIALIANKRALQDSRIAELAFPMTLEHFVHTCKQIEARTGRHTLYSYGFNLTGNETDFLHIYPFLQAFRGGLAETQGMVQLNSSENVAGFRWLKQFVRECRVLFADMQTLRQRFAQNEIVFISDGPWIKSALEDLTGEAFDQNFMVCLNPVVSGANSYSWTYNHALTICTQSTHKLQAATLIDALSNDPQISAYAYEKMGHLPVNQAALNDPRYQSDFHRAYKRQLVNARCINAQNMFFEKAMDFCVDAMKKILFEGADIQRELDEKEYILNMLYSG